MTIYCLSGSILLDGLHFYTFIYNLKGLIGGFVTICEALYKFLYDLFKC